MCLGGNSAPRFLPLARSEEDFGLPVHVFHVVCSVSYGQILVSSSELLQFLSVLFAKVPRVDD